MTDKSRIAVLLLGGSLLLFAFVANTKTHFASTIGAFYTIGIAHAYDGDDPGNGCGGCGVGIGSDPGSADGGMGNGDGTGTGVDQSNATGSFGTCPGYCGGNDPLDSGTPAGAPQSAPPPTCDASGNIQYAATWNLNNVCPNGFEQPYHMESGSDNTTYENTVYDSCTLWPGVTNADLSSTWGVNDYYTGFCPYVNVDVYSAGSLIQSLTGQSCKGAQTLTFPGTAGSSYEVRVVDTHYGNKLISGSFTGPACAGSGQPTVPTTPENPTTTTTTSTGTGYAPATAVCSAANSSSVTINWDYTSKTSRGAACQYVIMSGGDLSVPYSSGPKSVWGVGQELPCAGSYTFNNLASAHTYSYWFHIHHTNGDNFDPDGSSADPDLRGSITTPDCTPATPSAPSTLSASCSASGTEATFSWSAVSGANAYSAATVPYGADSCPSGWTPSQTGSGLLCQTPPTTLTSITIPVIPGQLTTGIVYAGNTANPGVWSAPATKTFTCSTPAAPLPTASLSANPATIPTGSASQLTWSSTNATSCVSAGGFSTGGATSGSVSTGPLTTDSTYQITCTGPSGASLPAQAKVTVVTPTATISANPTRVLSGNPTTVSWTATNVARCAIARNGTAWKTGLTPDASGTITGSSPDPITSQTSYVLTCVDASAEAKVYTATAVVNVGDGGFQEF